MNVLETGMERRFSTQAGVEVRADGKSKAIVGYAAVFYDGTRETEYELWDGAVERIMPGAFTSAMDRPDDVRGLFNHDPNQIIGRNTAGTMTLTVDERGLRYEIEPPDSPVGHTVVTALQRGDVSGSSFAFLVPHGGQRWIEEVGVGDSPDLEVREITDVELFDVGPVTYPAYEATVSDVRTDVAALRDAWRQQRREAAQAQATLKDAQDMDIRVSVTMAKVRSAE